MRRISIIASILFILVATGCRHNEEYWNNSEPTGTRVGLMMVEMMAYDKI